MMHVFFPFAIIAAYLLGSIPFGLVIVKAHGKDLRSIGSGNIGATNVSRALGRKWAYVCFVLDVLKGLIPMLATMLIAKPDSVLTSAAPLSSAISSQYMLNSKVAKVSQPALVWRWAFGPILQFVPCFSR